VFEMAQIEGNERKGEEGMDTTTLLIVVVVVLILFGGGGFYWRGRRR
jgi:LPXTG-motif cell wall-anchored protein